MLRTEQSGCVGSIGIGEGVGEGMGREAIVYFWKSEKYNLKREKLRLGVVPNGTVSLQVWPNTSDRRYGSEKAPLELGRLIEKAPLEFYCMYTPPLMPPSYLNPIPLLRVSAPPPIPS